MSDHRILKNRESESRLFAIRTGIAISGVCVLLLLLLGRYFYLQVIRHDDFVTRSESNRVHIRPIPPARGLIYDRNGVLLAENQPGITLLVVVERTPDMEVLLAELTRLLAIDDVEIRRFRKLLSHRRPYEGVPLRYNLNDEEQGVLAVNEYRLAGIEVSAQLVRHYPLDTQFAHVVGYAGRINEAELKTLDPQRYSGVHQIGKTGLEKYYEDRLLGKVGYEFVETNARGRAMRMLERIDPVQGEDLHLYLDSKLQAIAIQALGEDKGAVVAIETATGGVVVMASTPGFDPNLFVTGISHANYQDLTNSPERPLFDRAMRGLYPPGSTVKPLFALAGLDSGVVEPSFTVYDPGFFQLDNGVRKYRDWKRGGHGRVGVYDAIAQSCDVFFYTLGVRMGIDRLHHYGDLFGLGRPSGIDLPGEPAGVMPSAAWKRGRYGQPWYPGDTVNTSIGQGFMLMSPLQLAVMASRMATRGEVREPRLVHAIGGETRASEPPGKPITIPAKYWDQVIDGMKGVIHGPRGTARQAVAHLSYLMAGKTGTAQVVGMKQNEKYDITKVAKLRRDHALFIAFAPADDPRIAVGVLVENGEHGSSRAAPVARQVIDAYLADYLKAQQPTEDAVGETAVTVEGEDTSTLPEVKPQ
ncbi:MAG: penicillin-binding protein 2 [Porticoccaceae bacterium]